MRRGPQLDRKFGSCLAVFVALRIAIPLAVLADRGHALPGMPHYVYDARPGDAYGYYSAVRELLATWRQPFTLLFAVVIVAGTAGIAVALVRRQFFVWAGVVVGVGLGLVGALLSIRMRSAGAPTIGWPLIWGAPLLPYRAAGLPLTPNIAFGVGLVISLVANSVTIVATAIIGRRITGRPLVGLIAAGAYTVWPLVSGALAGHRAWGNGTWLVDTGLHLYSEPVSTALVVTGLAFALEKCARDWQLAASGALLSLASVVRLSNVLIAAAVFVVVALRSPLRRTVMFAAGLVMFLPVELAYWSKGYTHLPPAAGGLPPRPFALRYVRIAWTDSLLWRPRILLLFVPLAVVGTLAVSPVWRRWLLWVAILTTAAFYSVYAVTDIHPRFFYVVFPPLLVLWAAGIVLVVETMFGRRPASG